MPCSYVPTRRERAFPRAMTDWSFCPTRSSRTLTSRSCRIIAFPAFSFQWAPRPDLPSQRLWQRLSVVALSEIRRDLGEVLKALVAAQSAGASMELDDAVELALSPIDRANTPGEQAPTR